MLRRPGDVAVKKAEHRLMLRGAQFRKEHGEWRLTCRMGVDIGREAGCEAGTSISANALGRSLTVLKWNARGLGARTRWGVCGELAIAQLASADAGSTVNTGRALWLAAGVAAGKALRCTMLRGSG